MFQAKAVEKIKTHIIYLVFFFLRKSCPSLSQLEKYCRAGQATDGNMAHAHCLLLDT